MQEAGMSVLFGLMAGCQFGMVLALARIARILENWGQKP